jgi:glycosyltransferase involved in cell wall biosynthesis
MQSSGSEFPFGVLQINTADVGGGAESIVRQLHAMYREVGIRSWVAVGRKLGDDPDVFRIPNHLPGNLWARPWYSAAETLNPLLGRMRGAGRLKRAVQWPGHPFDPTARARGREVFDFPGSRRVLDLPPDMPRIVHLHNLHGDYFDLRFLADLSHEIPTIITLHDAWLLSGHCAHSFDCERWRTGCGRCPDLSIYPALSTDGTGANWQRKAEIFRESRLYVATPSAWLMRRMRESMLAPAVAGGRVIPNGVDLSVFKPGNKAEARRKLGLPEGAAVLLFAANGIRENPWKDFRTLRSSLEEIAAGYSDRPILFLALGEDAPPERLGGAEIRFLPSVADANHVADYYRAADLYVHAARADTFPNTVIEALACGTPVVATAVGGIPEQIVALDDARLVGKDALALAGPSGAVGTAAIATGCLVQIADAGSMARAVLTLLNETGLREQLSANAARDAAKRFDRMRMRDEYLTLYRAMIKDRVHSA